MANGIYDLIQQGTETAKRYAQLGTPVLNFAKALTVGPSEAYISDTMRDQLVQKAKETELDKGTLGYEDFGLPVTTEGGCFTGGLFDLAANDPVAFGNVGSVGRVSLKKILPNQEDINLETLSLILLLIKTQEALVVLR